uniref:Alpha-1,3-glucosyltransferase n=1 Tax=Trichuris muris TaxID=70415 RepID=A0A5S6Q6J8_TRIMR
MSSENVNQLAFCEKDLFTFAVFVSIAIRCIASVGPYSGQNKPPMYGDYEAQRHWMEITINLPVKEWYIHSNSNDLMYWGLDYPPLTAYHSWILGQGARIINESWVELGKSHGMESLEHKFFMRCTVLFSDMLLFLLPCALYVLYKPSIKSVKEKIVLYLLFTLYPGYILVDFVHFQYNCVSLGLFMWAIVMLQGEHDVVASFFFVCALCYKQMELYHSPAIFCYLLGKCFKLKARQGLWKFMCLSSVVLLTFLVIWWPFVGERRLFVSVLRRLFPVERGLYEDKVANLWCSLSPVIKLNRYLSTQSLLGLCAAATLLGITPTCWHVLRNPTTTNLHLSLLSSSLSFFLCSYHVHEKSILLVAMPALLCVEYSTLPCLIFLIASVYSLLPLCVKDNGVISFLAVHMLYSLFIQDSFVRPPLDRRPNWHSTLYYSTHFVGILICVAWLLCETPVGLPDLFSVAMSAFSCAVFVLFELYITAYTLKDELHQKHE